MKHKEHHPERPTPSSQEKQREQDEREKLEPRLEKKIKRRHKNALLSVRLEGYFSEHPEGSVESFQEKHGVYLTETFLRRAKRVEKAFKNLHRFQMRARATLERQLEVESLDTISPKELGRRYMEQVISTKPQGEVSLVFREGLLFIEAEAGADVAAIEAARNRLIGIKEQKSHPPHGIYMMVPTVKDALTYSVNAAIVNHEDNLDPDKTYTHERQHYINHILGRFEHLELDTHQYDSKFKHKEYRQPRIKDELIARIVDGSTGKDLAMRISLLYQNSYEKGPSKGLGRKETFSAIKDIGRAIEASIFSSDDPDLRSLLAYHLLDVRLDKIAKHIQRLDTFYREKIRKYEALKQELPTEALKDPIPSGIFPSSQADAVSQAKDLYKTYTELHKGITFSSWENCVLADIDGRDLSKSIQEANDVWSELQTAMEAVDIQVYSESAKEHPYTQAITDSIAELPDAVLQDVFNDAVSGNQGYPIASSTFTEHVQKALPQNIDAVMRVQFVDEKNGIMQIVTRAEINDSLEVIKTIVHLQ